MQLKSIQWRISLWAGGAILAVATILVLYALNSSQRTHELVKEQTQRLIMNSVEKEVSAQVEHGASILTNRIESALSNARGLVPVFASLKETQKNQKAGAIRLTMNDILKNTLKSNQDLLGIYTIWEPNSLDTFDYLYKNDKENGYDGTGRFIPYWSKDQSGNVNLEALADYENQQRTDNGDRVGEYYLCPRDNKKECITNPYVYEVSGKEVLLTSLVTPIILNGEFVGVTGVDISLQFLNKLTDKISKSIYNGQNEVVIISNNGTVSAHSKNINIGQDLKSLYPNEWKERLSMIQSGEMLFKAAPGDNNIHVIVPIYFGKTGTPWSMMVKLPKTIVMAGVNELDAKISAETESDRTWQIVIGAIVTILALCFIWLASAGIVKPIRNSVDILVRAAKGDLTPRIEVRTQDETGELSKACNTLLDRTQPVIADVIKSSQLISESAEQSAVIASQTSNGVNKQQQEVDLLTAAANEMAATAQSVADSASLAAKATNEAQSEANKSQSVINDTTDSINILADEVRKAAQVILQLETESKSIHSIIDVIRGIAEQTNLLALNAAIEAARAGDQGRGFAVVADEVRTLAQRTQESTEEIQKMIENLQKGTTEAVQVMGQGQEKAENSVSKAVQAGLSLESIMQAVSTINDLNIQVASAAEQQNAVAEDISKNLSIIAKVAEETASGSQLSASSSDELTKLSDRLNKLVQQFTV